MEPSKLSSIPKASLHQRYTKFNTLSKTDKNRASLSTDNRPRGSQIMSFQKNISFPTIRSFKQKKNQTNHNLNDVANVVKQEEEGVDLPHHIKHPTIMSDHDQFNRKSNSLSKSVFRGKSLGVLGRVEQDKEGESELKTRKRKKSRINCFIDKDQFNKEQTGIIPKQEAFDPPPTTEQESINSITQIQQSKEGTTITLPTKSSDLNVIVDEVDQLQKSRDSFKDQITEIIQQQNAEDQKEQPLLRTQLQKLKEQKELMKKMIISDTLANDSANLQTQNVSIVATEPIKEEREQNVDTQK